MRNAYSKFLRAFSTAISSETLWLTQVQLSFQMLKSCKKLSMTVRSPSLPAAPSSGGAPWQMRQTCSWIDRQGRPVSPPIEYIRSSQMAPPERYGYGRASSKDRSIRRVSATACLDVGFMVLVEAPDAHLREFYVI